MNQFTHCDWLPERARWSYLARSGLPAVSREENFSERQIIDPLLTKLVRSRWLDIGLVFKHAKEEPGQYSAILTSHLVNNPYIFHTNLGITETDISNHFHPFHFKKISLQEQKQQQEQLYLYFTRLLDKNLRLSH